MDSSVKSAKFPLGQIVATPGALEALSVAGQTSQEFLKRHASGDWGDLDEADRKESDLSVTSDLRILSAYHLKGGVKIWIITKAPIFDAHSTGGRILNRKTSGLRSSSPSRPESEVGFFFGLLE
jgi:hypothetical protein